MMHTLATHLRNLAVFFLSLFSLTAHAEQHLEGHVHGLARLDIIIEGRGIEAQLTTPAANVLGFEHTPNTQKELYYAREVLQNLKAGDKLFLFPSAANCRMVESNVYTTMNLAAVHKATEPGENVHRAHNGHSEIRAQYHFHCANLERLWRFQLAFFDSYPGFQKIQVQLLSHTKQTGADLTPQKNSISF